MVKKYTAIPCTKVTKKRLENIMKYGDSFDSKLNEMIELSESEVG